MTVVKVRHTFLLRDIVLFIFTLTAHGNRPVRFIRHSIPAPNNREFMLFIDVWH